MYSSPMANEEDRADMIAAAQQRVAILTEQYEIQLGNFEAYVESETEALEALKIAKEKAAETLYHLQSVAMHRRAPARARPMVPSSPAPSSSSPATQPLDPRAHSAIEQRLEDARKHAAQGQGVLVPDIHPQSGKPYMRPARVEEIPDTSRIPPSFPVDVPEDAVKTEEIAVWESAGHPSWSGADLIDEKGFRHVKRDGRYRIFDQRGNILSDSPLTSSPAPSNGAAQ